MQHALAAALQQVHLAMLTAAVFSLAAAWLLPNVRFVQRAPRTDESAPSGGS